MYCRIASPRASTFGNHSRTSISSGLHGSTNGAELCNLEISSGRTPGPVRRLAARVQMLLLLPQPPPHAVCSWGQFDLLASCVKGNNQTRRCPMILCSKKQPNLDGTLGCRGSARSGSHQLSPVSSHVTEHIWRKNKQTFTEVKELGLNSLKGWLPLVI